MKSPPKRKMEQRLSEEAEGVWGFISSEKRIPETSQKDSGMRREVGVLFWREKAQQRAG